MAVFVNYQIPDELHRRLKIIAVERGITLKQAVLDALAAYADREEKPPPARKR